MRESFIIGGASLALLGACAQKMETADREKVIKAIQKAEEAQAAALGRRDLEAAVTVFAEDGTLYTPGLPPAIGRQAIKATNERVLKDPAFNVAIDEASRKWWVSSSGDLATTSYTYTVYSNRCGEWQAGDRAVGQPNHLGSTGRRLMEECDGHQRSLRGSHRTFQIGWTLMRLRTH
jgi:ketosteroid isomerase-like protein